MRVMDTWTAMAVYQYEFLARRGERWDRDRRALCSFVAFVVASLAATLLALLFEPGSMAVWVINPVCVAVLAGIWLDLRRNTWALRFNPGTTARRMAAFAELGLVTFAFGALFGVTVSLMGVEQWGLTVTNAVFAVGWLAWTYCIVDLFYPGKPRRRKKRHTLRARLRAARRALRPVRGLAPAPI